MTAILRNEMPRIVLGIACLICTSLLAWWAFISRKDYVLFPALFGVSAIVLANGLLMLVIVAVTRELSLSSGSLQGRVGEAILAIQWPKWVFWQPLITVTVEWISPKAVCEFYSVKEGVFERVVFARRLKSTSLTRQVRFEDWLGIWTCGFETTDYVDLTIEPSTCVPSGHPPKIHHQNGQGEEGEGSADGDLVEFRTYQQGDAANRVMWKLFARTGNLFVRKAEKTGSALLGIFLVCSQNDEPAAELAWYVTNKHAGRSQDFFGENWLFGTAAESSARIEETAPVSSAEWQRSRDLILSSGAEISELSPSELRLRINAFVKACGPGVTSVIVLMGKGQPFPDEGLDSACQYLQVVRSSDQKFVEWELIQR